MPLSYTLASKVGFMKIKTPKTHTRKGQQDNETLPPGISRIRELSMVQLHFIYRITWSMGMAQWLFVTTMLGQIFGTSIIQKMKNFQPCCYQTITWGATMSPWWETKIYFIFWPKKHFFLFTHLPQIGKFSLKIFGYVITLLYSKKVFKSGGMWPAN